MGDGTIMGILYIYLSIFRRRRRRRRFLSILIKLGPPPSHYLIFDVDFGVVQGSVASLQLGRGAWSLPNPHLLHSSPPLLFFLCFSLCMYLRSKNGRLLPTMICASVIQSFLDTSFLLFQDLLLACLPFFLVEMGTDLIRIEYPKIRRIRLTHD